MKKSLLHPIGIIKRFAMWLKSTPEPEPQINAPEYYRCEFTGGEWRVLASDGTPLLPFGADRQRAWNCTVRMNANIEENIAPSVERAKANRAAIAAHVERHFKHNPIKGEIL